MDWFAAVDIYCERTSAHFWAEPVNALSNFAVILPVGWGILTARRLGEKDPLVWALLALAAMIGLGSFVFHTVAQRWSELVDTLPIWSFLALYAFVAAKRLLDWKLVGWHAVALGAGTVLVLIFFANGEDAAHANEILPAGEVLNGSAQYLPAILGGALVVAGVWWKRRALWHLAAISSLAFVLALSMRTMDAAICPTMSLGTHFMWHLLNCLSLGFAMQLILRGGEAAQEAARETPSAAAFSR
ncbi:ceramidase domain-containing protein [Phaeovulum sp.]|uniref:ceramidase domain-containing protein n=1 Tax=Phaeovulum sp. TaxID=2934796 RepID=UPI0035693CB2